MLSYLSFSTMYHPQLERALSRNTKVNLFCKHGFILLIRFMILVIHYKVIFIIKNAAGTTSSHRLKSQFCYT